MIGSRAEHALPDARRRRTRDQEGADPDAGEQREDDLPQRGGEDERHQGGQYGKPAGAAIMDSERGAWRVDVVAPRAGGDEREDRRDGEPEALPGSKRRHRATTNGRPADR